MSAPTSRTLPVNMLRYGSEAALPSQIALCAGPLRMIYEGGDLRTIRLGEHEIVRRIYVAVRDHNWNTIPARLSNVVIEVEDDAFRIAYDARHTQGPIDFGWHGTVVGNRDGSILFSMDGAANATFRRNRIGFCVLHPGDACAGRPCRIEHVDGTTEEGVFPDHISPHQPFREITAIAHDIAPGVAAEVRFGGDIFEMEDQRNWTDDSYKTYCTPLRLPYPVTIEAGTRVTQSVRLTPVGANTAQPAPFDEPPVTFTVGPQSLGPLPRLGLQAASDRRPLDARERARIKALNPSHIWLELALDNSGSAEWFAMVADEARALDVLLDVALIVRDVRDLDQFLPIIERIRPPVRAWFVFGTNGAVTPDGWAHHARAVLLRYDEHVLIGGGTNAYFTQLNRDPPDRSALDVVSYSINPQVHAFDNLSLVENLEAQGMTVRSARHLIGDAALHIAPVSFRPRFNPAATASDPDPLSGQVPFEVDPRQMSLFGAAWTAGSIGSLVASGVRSITYYETAGWRGVLERPEGSPLPDQFRSVPGSVFPLYHVLADAMEFANGDIIKAARSHPLHLDGFAVRQGNRMRVVVANLRDEHQDVRVDGLTGEVQVRFLDETTAIAAMTQPEAFRAHSGQTMTADGGLRLSLAPYAVVCLTTAPADTTDHRLRMMVQGR